MPNARATLPRVPSPRLLAPAVVALFLAVLTALPARADYAKARRYALVVPRAMQRTAINMITFRHRETAIMQWVDMAASLADAETTRRSIARGSFERNPFLGRRPGGPRTYITLLAIGFGYGTMTQVIQERVDKPRPFTLGLTAMAAVSHAYVSYHNTTVCPGNLNTCNLQPWN